MSGRTDIHVVVLAGRDVNPLLARWLRPWPYVEIWPGADCRHDIPKVRNDIFRWFRDEALRPWLLMLDDDVVPVAQTAPLLACEADVASPRIAAAGGREAHPHTLSAAAVKVSRRAVERIPEPWFRWPKRGCECSFFFSKAYTHGFRPAKAGAIGHRFPVTVLPGRRFLFDREVPCAPL